MVDDKIVDDETLDLNSLIEDVEAESVESDSESDDGDEVEVWVVNEAGEPVPEREHRRPKSPDTKGIAPIPVEPAHSAAEEELAGLKQEIASLKEQQLRVLADFDNFRKRTDKERRDGRRYAYLEPIRDLLPVIDNLERAMASEGSVDDLKVGIEMTTKQFFAVLERSGVELVKAKGEPFDPAFHDAVSRYEDPNVTVPTVADVLQSGFVLHDRLIRPSMVTVAMPAEQQAAKVGDSKDSGEGTAD